MLISQKIATNPKFLKSSLPRNPAELAALRLEVIRSVKFLMGKHLFNGQDIRKSDIASSHWKKPKTDKEFLKKMVDALRRHDKFSKVPFPVISIENDSGLLLIRDEGDRVSMCQIHSDGEVTYGQPYGMKGRISTLLIKNEKLFPPSCDGVVTEAHKEDVLDHLTDVFFMGLELLVYLNVKNIKHVIYKPSRKENAGVTPMWLPLYEYRVIDIFRERVRYESLADVTEFVNDSTRVDNRRAHMVIGHFKEIAGKLFWWNCFMRSRKNLETKGFVEKDYEVH